MKKLTFIIPCYNASANIEKLAESLLTQRDRDWCAHFCDDSSNDGTADVLEQLMKSDDRFKVFHTGFRQFALRNIFGQCRLLESPTHAACQGIVAIIDGDDQLCNDDTVSLVKKAHDVEGVVAWTAHRWDINGMNISKEMPQNVNPYQWPWCSSHLKTFDSELLKQIPESNFKDHKGEWFQRGYDQALMLPLLKVASKRVFIPDVCYQYNIDSVSVSDRDWAETKQLQTVSFVRARGFIE